jgi:hypothetical protein
VPTTFIEEPPSGYRHPRARVPRAVDRQLNGWTALAGALGVLGMAAARELIRWRGRRWQGTGPRGTGPEGPPGDEAA